MLRNNLALDNILLSLESALKIEYNDKYIVDTIKSAKRRIENIYNVELSDTVYNVQANNRLLGDNLSIFMSELLNSLRELSLFVSITLYDKKFGTTLRDVNYLGFAKDNLMPALAVLQDAGMYGSRESFFPALVDRASNIEMGQIKRIITIMAVMEDIGVEEGVALVAQFLYAGCV